MSVCTIYAGAGFTLLPYKLCMNGKYFMQVAFAEVLRRQRLGKYMSQEALAKKAGVSRSYIAKLEKDSANPSVEMMLKIYQGLNLDLGRFGSEVQATYNNAVKLLSNCYAKSGADALHRFITLNTDPHRKP